MIQPRSTWPCGGHTMLALQNVVFWQAPALWVLRPGALAESPFQVCAFCPAHRHIWQFLRERHMLGSIWCPCSAVRVRQFNEACSSSGHQNKSYHSQICEICQVARYLTVPFLAHWVCLTCLTFGAQLYQKKHTPTHPHTPTPTPTPIPA